jgi:hypothetical protein
METGFTELASTDLSDPIFFEEVFLHYMHYLYPASKKNCIQELAEIRHRYNQKDSHTLFHLRDKIESVLYRYHKIEQSVLVAELIQMKRRIAQLERVIV